MTINTVSLNLSLRVNDQSNKIQVRYRWRNRWNNRPFKYINGINNHNQSNSPLFEASIAQIGIREELVFGEDTRIKINNTQDFPWCMICALTITSQNGSRWKGTGWFSGPNTIITAGHCVYMHDYGGWNDNIIVSPGKNGSFEPFGSCIATDFYSVSEWIQDRNTSFDYGAIILPKNCKFNNGKIGYFKYSNLSGLDGVQINIAGYPGDKPLGTQWYSSNIINSVTNSKLVYTIDTAGGQSGAPVWYNENGNRQVIGIHTNGSIEGNYATRINSEVIKNIRKWS